MAYSADKKPGELTALTSLATDDLIIVGDTSDVSEVAKAITVANATTALVTTTAVTTAGAVMDSELTSIADVKALDQSVVSGAAPVLDATNFTNLPSGTPEGTAVLSTGEVGGTKFLREDGDGTSSWQAIPAADVSKVGTPVNNQVGVWTGDGTIEGDAALTFDTATDTLATGILTTTGAVTATGAVTGSNLSGTNTGDEAAASETVAGVVELATDAEMTTGTDTSRAITPANAKVELDKKLALAGGTMTGDLLLGSATSDTSSIKLNDSALADEKWSGTTIAATAGATLAVGDVCYLASTGKWLLNDGILDGTDTGFDKKLGICVLASTDTNPTEILLDGVIASAAFPAFTVGSPVYLDDTAGDLVVAQPSTTNFAIRIVGYAVSATVLHFQPSQDYIVHV